MVEGDQLMIYIDSHGAEKSKNLKTHAIATAGESSSNLTTLEGSTIVDLDQLEILKKLAIKEYQTQSLGDRLCRGLKASVWTLKDEKEQAWSICEFKDKSAVLPDDLAGQFHKLK